MPDPLRSLLIMTILLSSAIAANAREPIRFSSGSEHVALIELYTSEGCSSCPPADRWLSEAADDADLWRKFVPVSFHVDYWDYIGWEDRFARAEYGDRQRRYAAEGGVQVVYTPGVFRNGTAWSGWRYGGVQTTDRDPAGKLTLTVDNGNVSARFDAGQRDGDWIVHVALLGMGLESDIDAGENVGRKLQHDFVALNVVSTPMTQAGATYSATMRLPATEVAAPRQAVVAWVTEGDRQAPVQATGGYL